MKSSFVKQLDFLFKEAEFDLDDKISTNLTKEEIEESRLFVVRAVEESRNKRKLQAETELASTPSSIPLVNMLLEAKTYLDVGLGIMITTIIGIIESGDAEFAHRNLEDKLTEDDIKRMWQLLKDSGLIDEDD